MNLHKTLVFFENKPRVSTYTSYLIPVHFKVPNLEIHPQNGNVKKDEEPTNIFSDHTTQMLCISIKTAAFIIQNHQQ